MILISHRGNLNGPNEDRENSPYYIMEAIDDGYDVEVDLWWVDGKVYWDTINHNMKLVMSG